MMCRDDILESLRNPVLPEGVTAEAGTGCIWLVIEGAREVRIDDCDLSVELVEREARRLVGECPVGGES